MRVELVNRLRNHFGERNEMLSDDDIVKLYENTLFYALVNLDISLSKFGYALKKSFKKQSN